MRWILQSKIVSLLLLGMLVWMSIGVKNIREQRGAAEEQVANVRAKLEQLERDNNELGKVITYLKNPEYLARQAREKLNYKIPEEEVVYVYPEEKKATESSSELTANAAGILEKVKNWWYTLVR